MYTMHNMLLYILYCTLDTLNYFNLDPLYGILLIFSSSHTYETVQYIQYAEILKLR